MDCNWTVVDLLTQLADLSLIDPRKLRMSLLSNYPESLKDVQAIPDVEPEDRNRLICTILKQNSVLMLENMDLVHDNAEALRFPTPKERDDMEAEPIGGFSSVNDEWDVNDLEDGLEMDDLTGTRHDKAMQVSSDENGDDILATTPAENYDSRHNAKARSSDFTSLASLAYHGDPSSPLSPACPAPAAFFGLCGLTNLGNTCYMNAGLQLLNSVHALVTRILSTEFSSLVRSDNPMGWGGEIATGLAAIFKQMWSGISFFSPKHFKSLLGRVNPMFEGYGQHDCQEFLTFVLDALHEDINAGDFNAPRDCDFADPDAVWELHRRRNASFVVDLFHGLYRSKIVCDDCHHR